MKIHVTIFLGICLLAGSCKDDKQYHDEGQSPYESVENSLIEAYAFQAEMNAIFKNPETSPLPDRYRKSFKSLNFFEPDSNFIVRAKLERTPNAIPFNMPTTTNRVVEERLFGIARFKIKEEEFTLELYESMEESEGEPSLFLPFLDLTNGEETYEGGRYIDLPVPEGDTFVLDFNKAYNPYCAYNPKYSCPVVPAVNSLDVAITAGVKNFIKKP